MYIDNEILKKYSITIEEFAVIILSLKHAQVDTIIENLISRNLGVYYPSNPHIMLPNNHTEDIFKNILLDSDKNVNKAALNYDSLAEKMRELYPSGKKPGTQHQWQGSTAVISQRLKTLVKKYGVKFTEEEALDATKRYIAAFNGNYQFMHILKYFIFKDDDSQLLSYLENKGEDNNNEDWTNELR